MSRKTCEAFISFAVVISFFSFVDRGYAQSHRIGITNDTAYYDGPPGTLAPSRFTSFDVAPEVLKSVDPFYPAQASYDSIEGTVWVNCWITSAGAVRQVTILKTDNRIFNKSALECCLKWTFKPAKKDGKAIDVIVSLPLRFRMSNIDANGRAVQNLPPGNQETKK